jgi:hypothetical protein
MEMPVVSESRTGRSLSLKMLARYAITTEHPAFWHATAAGHASKPVMINIEIAPGKTVVVAENKAAKRINERLMAFCLDER